MVGEPGVVGDGDGSDSDGVTADLGASGDPGAGGDPGGRGDDHRGCRRPFRFRGVGHAAAALVAKQDHDSSLRLVVVILWSVSNIAFSRAESTV